MRSFRQFCESRGMVRETAVSPGNVQLVNANAAAIAKALNGLPQGPQVLAALGSLTAQAGVQLAPQQPQAPTAKPPAPQGQQQVPGQVAAQPQVRPGVQPAQPAQAQQQVARPGVQPPAQPVQAGAAVPGKR